MKGDSLDNSLLVLLNNASSEADAVGVELGSVEESGTFHIRVYYMHLFIAMPSTNATLVVFIPNLLRILVIQQLYIAEIFSYFRMIT